ncbi:unnamed protein product [Microthlaspi erraticum]|uniref:Uncharacterized protein n=1 Tax=Microthlaspi erraticum TaxID=1685480 RepID=A0A6D2KT25_9BRAS|nr:unnamed protein product [Microthlaspi erraticum]
MEEFSITLKISRSSSYIYTVTVSTPSLVFTAGVSCEAMNVFISQKQLFVSVGAVSLAGDLYGVLNLFVMGHGDCLQFIRCFNVPLMVLGGKEIAVGVELDDKLPPNECMDYYEQENRFHIKPEYVTNFNRQRYGTYFDHWLSILKMYHGILRLKFISAFKFNHMHTLLRQLSKLVHAPRVQFQDIPSTSQVTEVAEIDMETRQGPPI